MKSFKMQLTIAEREDIYLYKALTALEVECQGLCNRDDENFETVCEFVYDWIMKSDISIVELCTLIRNAIDSEEITLDDIANNPDKVADVIYDMM